ncbi:YggS family pyridoxal phosphate-dependent enzyme [Guptibacillus algicola]|uniref:YggS family pyridoxal phosphate-dependent enzyme n=1 Tax=Guptibacillus algicola TaxID=225844 RepID=UPI001CD6A92D|nr:YggS family pyridoxal phosphate-dependent enzyme [Alkalihalobacillus algicola]MCA0987994.1 YggS family pyridoxal phosphate-dependent enzyme [Alkalihalobacillus algicola]
MEVRTNLDQIVSKIKTAAHRSNRNPEDVNIIAVTKYVSVDRAKEAVDAGLSHLGENRQEGLIEKVEAFEEQPVWHFIGTLQSRKVKEIIDHVDYIHSLDRRSLAKEINKRASRKMKCFVQVNVSGEESKHGLTPEHVMPFVESLENYPNIEVVGLMTMAPHIKDAEEIRTVFQRLKELQILIQKCSFSHAPCKELSMGMSNDYEIAVEEGATFVRIGSSLVG